MADKAHFQMKVQELIPDNGQRDQLFDALRQYQSSQKLHQLLVDLRQILDEPDKLELFEFIRPLILLRHQMEYSYLTPPAPGVRLRTIRLHRTSNQSLGFAVRGGYEFSVGVFVSKVEPGSQAEKQGLKVGDEIVRVNGFTIAEAIHEDVLNLIKSRDEIVLKVTHIGMLPVKEHASDSVTWQYVEDMDSKRALDEVLAEKQVHRGKGVELKIFIDCTGYDSIGCGILSGPHYYPGIFVEKVRPGSVAQEVGLEVGDQIVEVNDTSFQNIGHKEAVVVLKGSKQLNVIVRKHAGLPLFERRQTPSRGSSVATVSSQPPSSASPPISQRSIPTSRPPADSGGLDEDQLIAEQLSRASLLKKTTTTTTSSNPASDSHSHHTSFEGHMISTQAEVHSDSDSYHGSGGDVPSAPVEELSPSDFPVPTSLSLPSRSTTSSTLSLALPDILDTRVTSQSATSEQLAFQSLPTTTTTITTYTAPTTLSLPDDLGDPVLAALRRPIYPPDAPAWVIPRTYANILDPDLALNSENHNADHLENVKGVSFSVQNTQERRGLSDQHSDGMADTLNLSSGREADVSPGDGVLVGQTDGQGLQGQEEALSHGDESKDGEEKTTDDTVQSYLTTEVDENSNVVKTGNQGLQSDSESLAGVTADGREEVQAGRFLAEKSDPPVFIPPPPPSSPPPLTVCSSSSGDNTTRSLSRLSSASSTQTLQAEDEYVQSEDGFEAMIEFGSETDESSHGGEIETGEGKEKVDLGNQGKDHHVAEPVAVIAGTNHFFAGTGSGFHSDVSAADFSQKSLPKLSHMPGWWPKMGEDEQGEERVVVGGVNMTVPAEVHLADSTGIEITETSEHDLPPPPSFFFEEESGSDTDMVSLSAGTHANEITPTDTAFLSADPFPPPSSQANAPSNPRPPSPTPSFSMVLGGAAAVLAARREAQEEEKSPRLLGPAKAGLSAEALGGVGLHCLHDQLAAWFNPLELDGRELKAFSFPKSQTLGVALEGGTGTPLAGRIVVAAVFGSGAAVEQGLQTGDQLMMINGHKLTDVSVAEAEQILEDAYNGTKEMIQVVYAQSNFLNDEECVTYF